MDPEQQSKIVQLSCWFAIMAPDSEQKIVYLAPLGVILHKGTCDMIAEQVLNFNQE